MDKYAWKHPSKNKLQDTKNTGYKIKPLKDACSDMNTTL